MRRRWAHGKIVVVNARRVAAALMIGATISAIATAITAHSVLRSTSGTHFVLLVFLPILLLPGLVVWCWPRPRTFGLWTTWGAVSSVIWAIGGSPYQYERDLGAWPAVEVSAWVTIAIVVVGSATAVFWLSARPRTAEELATPVARRLRRIVHLVVPIAAVTGTVGLLPGYRMYFDDTFLHEQTAGGGWLILFLALALAPAAIVHRDPRRRWAWIWAAWTLPSGFLVMAVSFGFSIFQRAVPLWPAHVVRFGVGTILVLLVFAVPIIALGSRGSDEPEPSRLPQARLRSRS